MATTTNRIYYPNDYDSVADIPEDMKKMAESVDTKVSENKTEIEKIKKEQTTQSTNISNLQKDNTTNKQDITNIKAKDTEQDKYIAELEAENARLREDLNGLPKGQASGESIDLSDSAEMRCDLKISGNSKQETREGYNLLPNNATTMNISGVDFTVNKNGTVLVNGTSTATAVLQLNAGITYSAGTYKLSGCPKGGTPDTYRFDLMNNSDRKIPAIDIGNGAEFTITEETTFIPRIRIQSGVTINNLLFEPMLVSDTSKTKYEQYGASPSPDYPSENECCGDNINFFDKDNANILDGCYINESKKIISSNAQSKTLYIEIQPNTTYTIHKVLSSRFAVGTFVDTPAVNVPLTNFLQDNSKTKITITSGENDNYLAVFYYHSNYDTTITPQEILNSIKIENGQGYINVVICNKNLFDKNSAIKRYYYNSKGVLSLSDNWFYQNVKVKPNTTYYISGNVKNNDAAYFIEFDENMNYVKTIGYYSSVSKFTTSDETQYVGLSIPYYEGADNDMNTLQIEEGTTATPYEEHKSQTYTIPTQQSIRSIEIAKNTFLRDTFIKKNNKWYERHYISRKIFDGTETFKYSSGTSVIYTDVFTDRILGKVNFSCNCFKVENFSDYSIMTLNTATGDRTNNYRIIFKTEYTNADDFKAWITAQYNAGTPVYIDYILETPLDIECTEEQSTILFDIEQNAKTYDKVTHMYSTDNVSSYKDVTYKKDLDTMITNIEQAILSQGGNI